MDMHERQEPVDDDPSLFGVLLLAMFAIVVSIVWLYLACLVVHGVFC